MKILLLSTGGYFGGEESFTKNLALCLQHRGHTVEVASGGIIQQKDLERSGVAICPINITSRRPLGILRAANQLAKYARTNQVDIIHSQSVGPAIMCLLAKRFLNCNVPIIWHNHGISSFAYRFIVRHFKKLDKVIAVSDSVCQSLLDNGLSEADVIRIHNGIDYPLFYASDEDRRRSHSSLCAELGINSKSFLYTYMGRLSYEKGVDILITAFQKVSDQVSNAKCIIVGDGDEMESLKRLADQTEASKKVHFLGFRSDVKEILSASDVLIQPSRHETFGLTISQAFASGTPCIGANVDGIPEQILNYKTGLLFTPEDSDKLAKLMIEINHNFELRTHLANEASKLCKDYLNLDRMTSEIIELYKHLIANSQKSQTE